MVSHVLCSLRDLGHIIIGVEFARQAVEEFFRENDIAHSVKPLPAGTDGSVFEVVIPLKPMNDPYFPSLSASYI